MLQLRPKIHFSLWIFLCGHFSFAETVELKFEMLKGLLETKSARVQAANLQVEATKEKVGSFGRSFFPKLEVHGAQESFINGDESERPRSIFGAEVKVNLYNGGRDRITSEIEKLEVSKKNISFEQVKAEELQEVRRIFLDIVYFQERRDLLELAVKLNSSNLKAAERRIRSGVATESDRVEFEMKEVDLKRDLSQARLQIEALVREFSTLLNFQQTDRLIFPRKLEHSHEFETLLVHDLKDHEFLYRDDELSSQQLSLQARSIQRKVLPQIEAYASMNDVYERWGQQSSEERRRESVVGLRFLMDTGNVLQSLREASAYNKESAALGKIADFKKRNVHAHITNELAELKFLHDQVHDAEVNIERAEKYHKLTQSEYIRGVKNSPDVLGASEKLFENRLKHLEIIKEFQRAKTHILAKIGK